MISDNLILKQKLYNIENELNLLLSENNLKIDFSVYDMGSIERGTYSRVKLKAYKEL